MGSRDDSVPWVVHKFGGSSVADARCMERVAEILDGEAGPATAVVLSAMRGVTDALLALVDVAERRGDSLAADLRSLRERHALAAAELLRAPDAESFTTGLVADLGDIEGVLRTVAMTRSAAADVRDLVAGYGELWSTRLFHALLGARGRAGVRWLDAREFIVVEWGALGPSVDWAESRRRLADLAPKPGQFLIVPGFVARDGRGVQTTLGRNGSDFSASILGALLAAREIQIWTDVPGVLSADPRRVPDARVIDALTYDEAMELAYFGAKVLHPKTMAPAVERGTPIRIRSTFDPQAPGTTIGPRVADAPAVKGITSIDEVALINLEGAGLIGVPGTAQRMFGALREEEISVILISQGSSEHSICCAVPQAQACSAVDVVQRAFERELRDGQVQSVGLSEHLSILAVVGDGMAGTPGVAANVFTALGGAGVNVRAIAQGASERNISVVIDGRQTTRALRAAHSRFYLSPHTISIGLIGPGQVGASLIEQIAARAPFLRREANLDLRLRAIAGSSRMHLAENGIDLERWREAYDQERTVLDLQRFREHVHVAHLPHAVIVDCTASEGVAATYESWLAAGIHVVTPNKKANSAALAAWRSLQVARRAGGTHYLYEATVGAGLPVIQTLRDLLHTGDTIHGIEGILSGTLAWLFNRLERSAGTSPGFSASVLEARRLGYTEPDPRDDLSGTDVARKIVILGREMGLDLELGDVAVESLVPPALRECSVEEFLQGLSAFDDEMAARMQAAAARGRVLRYVGKLTAEGEASVSLMEIERGHPLANIASTDNIVRFATSRYCENPLIVQGPGAGPKVTAGGVFADILRLAAYLGARL